MIFEYFPDSDMLYLRLAETTSSDSQEVAPGIVLDFDADNQIVGIEIEDASRHVDLSRLELRAMPIANIAILERISEL